MKVKCQFKDERVKNLTFHRTKPWIAVSLHNGSVYIYDYERGAKIKTFSEKTSIAVRGLAFNPSFNILATGADDGVVRIYNYQTTKLVRSIAAHSDYIRAIDFDTDKPFLLSCSDDTLIKIFNWKTGSLVMNLQGSNHYVMSAFFVPSTNYIISASLDDFVRVWKYTNTEYSLLHSYEDHTNGVNFVSYGTQNNTVVTCSDDKTIKLYRYGVSLSFYATLRGHGDSVSAAVFHPAVNVIISVSEDYTARFWDPKDYVCVHKHIRIGDRFWMVACHPSLPLCALAHDSGFDVISIHKTGSIFDIKGSQMLYVKNHTIRCNDSNSNKDEVWGQVKGHSERSKLAPLELPPVRMAYNDSKQLLILEYDGFFEIHSVGPNVVESLVNTFNGSSPIWVSRTQVAYLSGSALELNIIDFQRNGATTSKVGISKKPEKLFSATTGKCYIVGSDYIMLFDLLIKKETHMIYILNVKKIKVSGDGKNICIISANAIYYCNWNLTKYVNIMQPYKVRSCIWYKDIILFCNAFHLYYMLPNGDHGIITSLDEPVKLCSVREEGITVINRLSAIAELKIDLCEFLFKYKLSEGKIEEATGILSKFKMFSESIIDYIQKKGYPQLALSLVKDLDKKFSLCIEAGDLEQALKIAQKMNKKEIWSKLYDIAMLRGRFSIAEVTLINTGDVDRLAFFYLISGQINKLKKMQLDNSLSLHRAIWLNDMKSMSNLLSNSSPLLSFMADENAPVKFDDGVKAQILSKRLNKLNHNDKHRCDNVDNWPVAYIPREKISANINVGAETAGSHEVDGDKVDNKDGDGWDINDMDQLPDDSAQNNPTAESLENKLVKSNKNHPGILVAAGKFEDALMILDNMISLVNHRIMKEEFLRTYASSHAMVYAVPTAGPIMVTFGVGKKNNVVREHYNSCIQRITRAYEYAIKENFSEAKASIKRLLRYIPLSIAENEKEQSEIQQIVFKCRDFLLTQDQPSEIEQTTTVESGYCCAYCHTMYKRGFAEKISSCCICEMSSIVDAKDKKFLSIIATS